MSSSSTNSNLTSRDGHLQGEIKGKESSSSNFKIKTNQVNGYTYVCLDWIKPK